MQYYVYGDDYIALAPISRNVTQITLNENTTEINQHAFYDCTSLTSITIPSSVTSIDGWAFFGCDSLSSVYIDGQDVANMLTGTSVYFAGGLLDEITTGEKVYVKSGLSVPAYMTNNFNFTKQSDTMVVNGVTYDVYVRN